MLLHLPNDHGAEAVRDQMIDAIARMPARIRKTVTWDQGSEMARHLEITATTGVQATSAPPPLGPQRHPRAAARVPTQRRQPVPIHPTDLDDIEDLMNNRPRKALNWLTPIEYLTKVLEEDTVALTE